MDAEDRNYIDLRITIEEKDEKIEQLKKEKEWLMKLLYNKVCQTPILLSVYKLTLEEEMQQALKEK